MQLILKTRFVRLSFLLPDYNLMDPPSRPLTSEKINQIMEDSLIKSGIGKPKKALVEETGIMTFL